MSENAPEKDGDGGAEDRRLIPVKIHAKTYQLLKVVASYKGLTLAEYLHRCVEAQYSKDADEVIEGLRAIKRRGLPK